MGGSNDSHFAPANESTVAMGAAKSETTAYMPVANPDATEKYALHASSGDFEKMKDYNLLGQPRWPRWKSALAFFGLAITMYLVCVAETVFNQILGDVKGKLNTTIYSQWMEASFLLTCVIVQPVWVKLAEKFGRPGPLFSSILIFMLFSIMVGAAKSMLVVCIGRALQGIGGAGMMPLALVVLTDILTPGERGVYMGILGAVIILGKWTGSIIGAALLEHSSWRWVGYLNLPAGAVALAILYFTLHDIPRPVGSVSHKLREFDYLGTLFWLGGGLMILLGLSWGGNEHPWKSTLVVCLFVFGFIVILIFAAVEGKFAKWPIIPLSILLKVRTLLTLVASFCIGVCMYGMIMFVPVYYMMLEAEGPLESSRHILWCVLGGCIGCILGGVLVSIRGRVFYRELAVLGTLIMTIGFGLLYTWPKALEKEKQAGFQVLVGLGLGLCMQQILLASQAGLPADEVSTVTTLIDYARTLGGMIGLVIGEVILKQKMFVAVQQAFSMFGHLQLEGKDVVSLEAMAPLLQKMPKTVVAPVYDGIVRALHLVFVSNVPFAALACILCLFIANIPLHVILPARNTEEVPETLRTLHAED